MDDKKSVRSKSLCWFSPSFGLVLLLTFLGLARNTFAERVAAHAEDEHGQGKIDTLVRQLGAQQFSQRTRARDELLRIGPQAFDALFAALESEDVEIRLQARSLIRSIPVGWLEPTDPESVKGILDNYRKQNTAVDREESMQRLTKLPGDEGLPALCRIVRFEISDHLSKRAALLVMLSDAPSDPSTRESRRSLIDSSLAGSRRTAAQWLRSYGEFLLNPSTTIDDWQQFIHTEEEVLRKRPSRTQRDLVREFLQWRIRVLDQVGRRAEAIAVINESSLLEVSDAAELGETLEWLIKRKAWTELDEVARKHESLIGGDPYALYLLARSQRERNQPELAERLAEKAFRLTPNDQPLKRLGIAKVLLQGIMRDWAEREYRHVIDNSDADSPESRNARYALAIDKHHWGEHKVAADLLEPLVKTILADRDLQFNSMYIVGIHHYALGLHYQEAGEVKNAKENLRKAWNYDQSNVDALIAMYRIEIDDEAWKASIRKQIQEQIEQFDDDVKKIEQQYQLQPNPRLLTGLAICLNQYAWMVGNTFGDYDLALARSKRSLEIKPDYAGYLDTLARCYFAVDDCENALSCQRRAAELEPFEGQIVRQLEFFEKHSAAKRRPAEDTFPRR